MNDYFSQGPGDSPALACAVKILLRGDSGFCREQLMALCKTTRAFLACPGNEAGAHRRCVIASRKSGEAVPTSLQRMLWPTEKDDWAM